MEDLEDLPGQEGSRYAQSEVFGPGFLKVEADALGEADSRVDKGQQPIRLRRGSLIIEERS